jgi:hypothetical protein
MTSTLDVPRAGLLGDQRPRLQWVPRWESSEGQRVADLAAAVGLRLDDWERHVLVEGLGRVAGGQWAAFEKALIVSRQNGKGAILEALELGALFLDDFGVDLILHSAHEFKTASEAFRRVQGRIENHPAFRRRVRQVYLQRGAESIELRNGKRLRFIARSGGSGRGFSADLVILDEAYELGDDAMAALLPTLSARPNPQIWYTSTAGLLSSAQLGAVRARALAGDAASLAFFEWSVDPDDYDPADPGCWARANPGLGIRITPEYIEKERAALAPAEFARERLGIGDYPVGRGGWRKFSELAWKACADLSSRADGQVALAFSVERDGTSAVIAVAGRRPDGLGHAELTEPPRAGTAWLTGRLAELAAKHDPCVVVMNGGTMAPAFERELAERGFSTKPGPGEWLLQITGTREYAQACGALAEDVKNGRWRFLPQQHLGREPLTEAAAAAGTRPLADAWAWSRKESAADISPLEAVTLARHGFMTHGVSAPSQFFGSWR